LNPERVGRDGFLRLRFARHGDRTVLAQSRFSLPLQTLAPLALDDGACHVMLLNPTGGVLGGDRLITEIILEGRTHACLTTPSATRIYRTASEPAILDTVIHVGEGSTLEYFPDHIIPHAGSSVRQSLRLEMEQGSCAILLDAMAAGRIAHGERWNFLEIDSKMAVHRRGEPIYINRTKITPSILRPDKLGFMEEFDYFVAMSIFADGFKDWENIATALNAKLDSAPQIHGGTSIFSHHGCAVRFLARSASDMSSMNKLLWDAARELIAGLAPVDLRKY
jgi:urease accessory protein